MRRLKNKRGQSTLEYLLILTGLVAAIVAGQALIKQHMRGALTNAAEKIDTATSEMLGDLNLGK